MTWTSKDCPKCPVSPEDRDEMPEPSSPREPDAMLADSPEAMLDSIKKLMDQVENLRDTLATVMRQSESDLQSAHAEICKLQGLDPEKHHWPAWSPQNNSLHWFKTLRQKFRLDDAFALTQPSREPDAREALAARIETILSQIAGQNDLEGVPREDCASAAFAALYECETLAREAIEIFASLRQPAAPGEEVIELIAGRENLKEAWAALAMIRETVETLAPSGAVKGAEYLGPTFTHEADALVEGIIAIQSSPSPSDERAWKCKANPTGVVPSDCDWPGCGCDPHAERVIRGLIECGWEPPSSKPSDERAKVMEEMLNFFTRHYEPWMDNHKDEAECIVHSRHTFGDLRRARAALFPSTPPPNPNYAKPAKICSAAKGWRWQRRRRLRKRSTTAAQNAGTYQHIKLRTEPIGTAMHISGVWTR